MDDFSEDGMDRLMEDLIEEGYIYEVGIDDSGDPLYQTTEKFREDFPEMFAEQIAETNNTIYSLWMLGLVDVTVKEETNDWIVLTNEKTMNCDTSELTQEERNIIMQLRYRQYNDRI